MKLLGDNEDFLLDYLMAGNTKPNTIEGQDKLTTDILEQPRDIKGVEDQKRRQNPPTLFG